MKNSYLNFHYFILWLVTGTLFSSCSHSKMTKEAIRSDEIFGIPILYDARPGQLDTLQALMTNFTTAYLKQDQEGLQQVLAPNFKWHLHSGNSTPVGQTKVGVEGMLEELARRAKQWTNVNYSNVEIYCTESTITQLFHIQGKDEVKGVFNANGVDVYKMENGKLLSKDSYWKQIE